MPLLSRSKCRNADYIQDFSDEWQEARVVSASMLSNFIFIIIRIFEILTASGSLHKNMHLLTNHIHFPLTPIFTPFSDYNKPNPKIKQHMKQAQRVYLRHKIDHEHQSPFFKSNVQRSVLDPLPKLEPGPGSYEVSLPLVKPKYEAIFKNNRSIIIKVNDIPVPAFASREARFKQYSTIDSKMQDDLFDLRELEKQRPQYKVKNSRRYNFSMPRKKSNENISSTTILSSKYNTENETVHRKGPEWSKYREERKIWVNRTDNPGPGSYQGEQKIRRSYIKDKKSWQFRSETKRSQSFGKNNKTTLQIPQMEQKINSIHSRHNLEYFQY